MSSTLSLPLNFGERPCDRVIVGKLSIPVDNPQVSRGHVLWALMQIWRDFAIARDDRREVPLDAAARAKDDAVTIIEQFAGWWGEPGAMVEICIAAGFFTIVPLDEARAELVLTDFFPANHGNTRGISNSSLGGIKKSVRLAGEAAEEAAKEQLNLFQASGNELVNEFGAQGLERIMIFVHQLCGVLGRPAPKSNEWKAAIVPKAAQVLNTHMQADIHRSFCWFKANKSSQEIPPRLDFILDTYSTFIEKARKDFK